MEKRKLPRHSIGGSLKAAIKSLLGRDSDTPEIIRANVLDLSHGGAGLCVEVISSRPYQPGNSIFIEIKLANGTLIGSEGEVKWTRPLSDQAGYQLGVQFKKIDNQDKARLHKFLNELDKKRVKG
jgi:c-di-GMP-binding flagellar brake protein YcgR